MSAALAKIGLESYAAKFDEAGYDDLGYLHQLNAASLAEVADDVGMKPGHRRKSVDKLSEVR